MPEAEAINVFVESHFLDGSGGGTGVLPGGDDGGDE